MKKEYYELTNPQKNIWMVELVNDGSNINNIAGVFYIKNDEFKYDIHNEVLNELIKNNEALRLNIIKKGEEPLQYIREFKKQNIEVLDMSLLSEKDFNTYIKNEMLKPINILGEKLYEFKIIKLPNMKTCIYYKFHHIISDAWGLIQVATQYSKIYEKLYNNIENDLEVPSYIEYINSEKQYMESDKYKKDEEFWNEYLKDINEPVALKNVSKKINKESKRYIVKLDKELNEKINMYCKNNKVSPYVLFLTALSTYIYRIKDINDFIIGTPVLNRSNFKEKQMLGMFISTIPMRFKIEENIKFRDLLKAVSCDTMSIFRHQKYPYSEIIKEVHSKTDIKANLYNIVLSYQNARANYSDNKKYNAIWKEPNCIQDDLDIHIVDINNEGKLEIYYDYLIDVFDKIEIKYLHTRLIAIIEDALSNEEVTVEDIRIMSVEEEHKILYEFNDTDRDYPKDKTVIQLFEEQVEKTPDNIALVFEDKKMTYRELNEKANQLAHYLREEKGVEIGDIIAVYMNRNEVLISALLAILKCGGTYIPIDPEYPEERVKYILENSNAKYVVTSKSCDFISDNAINVNNLNDNTSNFNLDLEILSDNLVYLIYTSGSTGNPKGVMINNYNLINFLFGINENIKISKEENVVSITTISFDIFGLEIWLTFLNGAKLVLSNEKEQLDSSLLNSLCIKNNVDIIQTTPTKLRLLTSDNNNLEYIKNMKKVLLGGETLPEDYIKKLKKITNSSIINVYGPTETTIWSTIKDITKTNEITAGKPIQNTKLYILDNKNRLLPYQIEGQLAISGESVSKGYYNNVKLTEEKFINNKFIKDKIYLTGDLALIDFEQELKILGRTDFQIKLNGQRIELEEIEKNIVKFIRVEDAVVVFKDQKIICYYIDKNKEYENEYFRGVIQKKLPLYMIPSVFIKLDKFPLTANGKIDRKKILEYKLNLINQELSMPTTNIQKEIFDSWKFIFKDKKFGIDTNFFELGDSLDAIKLRIELLKKEINIEYSDIFKFYTIREISKKIEESIKIKEFDISNYNKDFSNILNSNKNFNIKPEYKPLSDILVTGVTGFLGSHVVSEILEKEKVNVYCLVRSKNNLTSKERLKLKLNYYFGDKYDELLDKRIFALDGDIIEKNLGMDRYPEISKKIEFVVHSAACVKHYGSKEFFFDINVKGTENVAEYCYNKNKKMIHISTISVSGNAFEAAYVKQKSNENQKNIFDETCFFKNQNVDNVYIYTKFKAEECVLEYINKGLKANIIRCGNLTGRYSDLKFQDNIEENAFTGRLKSIVDIGYIPKNCYNMYLEFTPVDLASEFIVKVMQYFNMNHNTFHVYNHNHVNVSEFLKILKKIGIKISVIEDIEFSNYIKKILEDENSTKKIIGIINDINENNLLDYSTNIEITSYNTIKYLNEIGFEWKKIDENYIKKYIEYLKAVKFLNNN